MKNHIKLLNLGIILISGITLAFTLNQKTSKTTDNQTNYTTSLNSIDNSKQLFESKCNICHSLKDSAAAMLAPPFVNIKSKYKAVYKTEDAFIKGMVDFSMNPTKEKALMRGSLNKFSVMPKLGYSKTDLTAIAKYVYATKFEKPSWFK